MPAGQPNARTEVVQAENIGAGIAVEVWSSCRKVGASHMELERHRMQSGIIFPTAIGTFCVSGSGASTERIVIVYRSLAGIYSAGDLCRDGNY